MDKKKVESAFKKSLRSVSASVPIAASIAQWWSEMEADNIQKEVERLKNPIPYSHPKAIELLRIFSKKIEENKVKYVYFDIDDELKPFIDLLNLWEKQNLIEGRHALGRRWIGLSILSPILIITVCDTVHGEATTKQLIDSTLDIIKEKRGGTNGRDIANKLKVSLVYIDALFSIFESEGKGVKSESISRSYFSPFPTISH